MLNCPLELDIWRRMLSIIVIRLSVLLRLLWLYRYEFLNDEGHFEISIEVKFQCVVKLLVKLAILLTECWYYSHFYSMKQGMLIVSILRVCVNRLIYLVLRVWLWTGYRSMWIMAGIWRYLWVLLLLVPTYLWRVSLILVVDIFIRANIPIISLIMISANVSVLLNTDHQTVTLTVFLS